MGILRMGSAVALAAVLAPATAWAADGYEVLAWDNFDELGNATDVVSVDWLPAGKQPVNDEWVFVYDPAFYFFLTGASTTPVGDRLAEFADKGFVIVAAAGSPGGNYEPQPDWLDVRDFSADYDAEEGVLNLSVSYEASYVPTTRGYQSYLVYTNYVEDAKTSALHVYDSDHLIWPTFVSGLRFGSENYLLTGDGLEAQTSFITYSPEAALGPTAMEVRVDQDNGQGSHWKLMLFANGNAAGYPGIDLTGYQRLEFYAKANRDVILRGAFGTGDDTAVVPMPALTLSTSYQKFAIDLTGQDLSRINTFLWVYLHRADNPGDLSDVSVFLDNVRLVKANTFVTEDGVYTLGSQRNSEGQSVYIEVVRDTDGSYLTPLSAGSPVTYWVLDRAAAHTVMAPLRSKEVVLRGFYVQECATGSWVNVENTLFAPSEHPLKIWSNYYLLNHFFVDIVTNGLMDPRFDCPDPRHSSVDVLVDGVVQSSPTKSTVEFAFVLEHR